MDESTRQHHLLSLALREILAKRIALLLNAKPIQPVIHFRFDIRDAANPANKVEIFGRCEIRWWALGFGDDAHICFDRLRVLCNIRTQDCSAP